jgi:hypothetical protein
VANYIVSYDLNGPYPTHQQIDDHLAKLGAIRARILETVWYVGWSGSQQALFDEVNSLMSANDQLIVVKGVDASFRNLLVDKDSFITAWNANR